MVGRDLGDEKQIVCFKMADEEYGIDIMQVREIVRIDAITKVPGAPYYVAGIVNLRGDVLPVIDLRRRFGLKESQSEQNRILVVEMGDGITGLIVDAVSEVLRIPSDSVEAPPPVLSSGSSTKFLSGVGKLDGGKRVVLLVDTEAILTQDEVDELTSLRPGEGVEKPVSPEALREDKIGELLMLKKEELISKAQEMGLNVDSKLTKRELAEMIVDRSA